LLNLSTPSKPRVTSAAFAGLLAYAAVKGAPVPPLTRLCLSGTSVDGKCVLALRKAFPKADVRLEGGGFGGGGGGGEQPPATVQKKAVRKAIASSRAAAPKTSASSSSKAMVRSQSAAAMQARLNKKNNNNDIDIDVTNA
jgi:hypothetical protein